MSAAMQGGGRGAGGRVPPLPYARSLRPLPSIAVLLVALVVGCGGTVQERVHGALDVVAGSADVAYQAAVAACLGAERAALAAAGTDVLAWERARGEIRPACDAVAEAFERAVEAEHVARETIDACSNASAAPVADAPEPGSGLASTGAAGDCVDRAIAALASVKRLVSEASAAWARAKPILDRWLGSGRP